MWFVSMCGCASWFAVASSVRHGPIQMDWVLHQARHPFGCRRSRIRDVFFGAAAFFFGAAFLLVGTTFFVAFFFRVAFFFDVAFFAEATFFFGAGFFFDVAFFFAIS
jgi:hypothetical protein